MSSVVRCHTITKQLKEALEHIENRESTIETIESLLDKRQILITAIRPPFTEEEQVLGKQMITWSQEIDKELSQLQSSIKRDMNGLSRKRTSVQKYANPYESLQYDGMFYDKKK
ncbi:MAG: flagellar protein FliT [Bacillota bacterium]|uniref:flagellar protein FliT n=1 Tax=Rossellomorea sp. FM04394 TaxID=3243076 RepID=UPI0035A6D794